MPLNNKKNWLILAGMAGFFLVPLAPASAYTVSANGVAFGTYDMLSNAPDDATGSVEIACHPSQQNVEISLGTGGSGSFAQRRMTQR